MASRRGLSIFALVLGFSQGLWADFVNFESGQVRPLALSSDGDHLASTVGASTDIIEASWLALNDALEYWLLER